MLDVQTGVKCAVCGERLVVEYVRVDTPRLTEPQLRDVLLQVSPCVACSGMMAAEIRVDTASDIGNNGSSIENES